MLRSSLLCGLLAGFVVAAAHAGPEVQRSAPREQAALTLAGKRLTIDYGRPALAGRPVFGVLVPWGEIWRTGADEASRFSSELDLRFAGVVVPKGKYSLFTVPSEGGWQLVLNQVADQWGAFNYDPAQDVVRVPMRFESVSAPIERLSMALTASGENAATLWIGWEKTVVSASFEVIPELGPEPGLEPAAAAPPPQ